MSAPSFSIVANELGNTLNLKLTGVLSESADFGALRAGDLSQVNIDLGDITHINSGGIRLWAIWMKNLTGQFPKAAVKFDHVPYIFFRQILGIAGFIPDKSKVESIYAPFECTGCGAETSVLLNEGEAFDTAEGSVSIPSKNCAACGSSMELDDHTENFLFALLKR